MHKCDQSMSIIIHNRIYNPFYIKCMGVFYYGSVMVNKKIFKKYLFYTYHVPSFEDYNWYIGLVDIQNDIYNINIIIIKYMYK